MQRLKHSRSGVVVTVSDDKARALGAAFEPVVTTAPIVTTAPTVAAVSRSPRPARRKTAKKS
jgi:hypothetical protein